VRLNRRLQCADRVRRLWGPYNVCQVQSAKTLSCGSKDVGRPWRLQPVACGLERTFRQFGFFNDRPNAVCIEQRISSSLGAGHVEASDDEQSRNLGAQNLPSPGK
jgi:hypothetical protein